MGMARRVVVSFMFVVALGARKIGTYLFDGDENNKEQEERTGYELHSHFCLYFL